MKNFNKFYSNPKQAVLPMLIQDYLDICDPVLIFDRFMGGIDLEKYLKNIRKHYTGRFRYDPVSMPKTVLFGFMMNGYISLRELEDQCRVEHVDLQHLYIDGSKFEANANKYTWVWKKATEKSRYYSYPA